MQSDRARFLDVVLGSETIRALTDRLAELELPDSYLAAGCLSQTVWNHVSGFPSGHGITDYDVLYCDLDDLSWDGEDRIIQRCRVAFADLGVDVQVRNQARVHLWFPEKFGIPREPLRSTREGIDSFLHCSSALGLRKTVGGYDVYAPSASMMSSGWSSGPTIGTPCGVRTRRRPTAGGGPGPASLSRRGTLVAGGRIRRLPPASWSHPSVATTRCGWPRRGLGRRLIQVASSCPTTGYPAIEP